MDCCLSTTQYYQCDLHDFKGNDTHKNIVMAGGSAVWGKFVGATNLINLVVKGINFRASFCTSSTQLQVIHHNRRRMLLRCGD